MRELARRLTARASAKPAARDRLNRVNDLLALLMDSSLICGSGPQESHEAAPGAFALLQHIRQEIAAVEEAL